MYASNGMGLAAPQVGINQRIMVFNAKYDGRKSRESILSTEKILINPDITERSEDMNIDEEGCLSFPRVYGDVLRHDRIGIRYQTITGDVKEEVLQGDTAMVFQHEYDHLDGVLFIDKLQPASKIKTKAHLARLIRNYGPGGAP
jgi:peptide deformylase